MPNTFKPLSFGLAQKHARNQSGAHPAGSGQETERQDLQEMRRKEQHKRHKVQEEGVSQLKPETQEKDAKGEEEVGSTESRTLFTDGPVV
jgi:hypothetical protein